MSTATPTIHDAAIADATRQLDALRKDQVVHYQERAMSWAKRGDLGCALKDVATIQDIVPEQAVGYLTGGQVYHELGYQAKAISMYDRGLTLVPPTDAHYQQLEQAKVISVQKNGIRVDFITKLPYDIAIDITKMLIKEIVLNGESNQYLNVSKGWQERICGGGLAVQVPNMLKPRSIQYFESLVEHITSLTCVTDDALHTALSASRASSFKSLKRLVIDRLYNEVDEYRPPLSYETLAAIGGSLQHLLVFYESCFCDCFTVVQVFDACPQLISLELDAARLWTVVPNKTYTTLTSLSLYGQARPPTNHVFEQMLSRLPSLEELKIFPLFNTNVLPVIQNYCPKLRSLVVDIWWNGRLVFKLDPNVKGLQQFYFSTAKKNRFDVKCDYRDIVALMDRNKQSLRHVVMDVSTSSIIGKKITDSNIRLEALTVFYYTLMKKEHVDLGVWIMKHAPNLKMISLLLSPNANQTPMNSTKLYNVLSSYDHLESVELHIPLNMEESDQVTRFIKRQHEMALRNRCSLQHLTMGIFPGITLPTLLLLASITTLKSLSINFITEDDTSNMMATLLEAIGKGLKSLEDFSLYGLSLVPKDILFKFKTIQNLQSLALLGGTFEPSGVLSLAFCSKLKNLRLESVVAVDTGILNILKEHIEKVDTSLIPAPEALLIQ